MAAHVGKAVDPIVALDQIGAKSKENFVGLVQGVRAGREADLGQVAPGRHGQLRPRGLKALVVGDVAPRATPWSNWACRRGDLVQNSTPGSQRGPVAARRLARPAAYGSIGRTPGDAPTGPGLAARLLGKDCLGRGHYDLLRPSFMCP